MTMGGIIASTDQVASFAQIQVGYGPVYLMPTRFKSVKPDNNKTNVLTPRKILGIVLLGLYELVITE